MRHATAAGATAPSATAATSVNPYKMYVGASASSPMGTLAMIE